MEFATAGWCTGEWVTLFQTVRNSTYGDMRIPQVVIQLRVTGLKKNRLKYLLDIFEGRGEKGHCVCEASFSDWTNGGYGSSLKSWSCYVLPCFK